MYASLPTATHATAPTMDKHKGKCFHGCFVGSNIAVLSLIIVKHGENNIPGLTNNVLPKLGPKRAMKIRSFFSLGKGGD
ncbi:hypothetical protein H0H87_002265, partial [Tephrocybe sp. NHM501043]